LLEKASSTAKVVSGQDLSVVCFLLFSVMQTERGRRIGYAVAETGKAVGA